MRAWLKAGGMTPGGTVDLKVGVQAMSEAKSPANVHVVVVSTLDELSERIATTINSDVLAIAGPIYRGMDQAVRDALESMDGQRRKRLAIVLDTGGGVVEIVDRMVQTVRHFYDEVDFYVPNEAMSAGTVFVLSGDRVFMDYFSSLGPIDPQVVRNNTLVPALSYLEQFDRLKRRAANGKLTDTEVILLQQLDLAELHKFEEAKELSVSLLKGWLALYKFKDWDVTETNGKAVTPEMRESRAKEVAEALMDQKRWHSHGKPISMRALREDVNLRIDDFGDQPELARLLRSYLGVLLDYIQRSTPAHAGAWAIHAPGSLIV